ATQIVRCVKSHLQKKGYKSTQQRLEEVAKFAQHTLNEKGFIPFYTSYQNDLLSRLSQIPADKNAFAMVVFSDLTQCSFNNWEGYYALSIRNNDLEVNIALEMFPILEK